MAGTGGSPNSPGSAGVLAGIGWGSEDAVRQGVVAIRLGAPPASE